MTERIDHYQINGKFRMQFERSAVKGQDGFKVEANSDNLEEVYTEAKELYLRAQGLTAPIGYGQPYEHADARMVRRDK